MLRQYQDGQWALDGPKYCQHAATWNAGLCNLVGQDRIFRTLLKAQQVVLSEHAILREIELRACCRICATSLHVPRRQLPRFSIFGPEPNFSLPSRPDGACGRLLFSSVGSVMSAAESGSEGLEPQTWSGESACQDSLLGFLSTRLGRWQSRGIFHWSVGIAT